MKHIKFEIIIDKLVPYAIGFILLHFVGTLFFDKQLHAYEDFIIFLEFFLVTFVLGFDLIFKYRRTKDKKAYFRHYWLEILAIFPFMLIFRLFEEAYLITKILPAEESISVSQTAAHEIKGVNKGAQVIVREAQLSGRASRSLLFAERLSKFPRILRAAIFFEHPLTKNNKRHHKFHFLFYSKHAKKSIKR